MKGFTTKAVHTPFLTEDPHGSLHMPVYDNAAFEFKNSADIEAAFRGQKPHHSYSRITNPTVEHLEQTIKNITGAAGVIAMSSGMAVISNLILTIASSGDNIITGKYLFGNTVSLFKKSLAPWGLKVKEIDMENLSQIENAIDGNSKGIFFETITNPQLQVANILELSKIAEKHNIPLIADSTLTPFVFSDMKKMGINIEIISSTKYISGGATSIGGLLVDHGNFDWRKNDRLKDDAKKMGPFALIMKLRRETYRNLGSCLSPHNAYLQSLGLETLLLRVEKSSQNALKIARYLEKQPQIKQVNYFGLESSPYYKIGKKQFPHFSGGVLTFDLQDKESCFVFMDKLQIIRRATNFNDNRSLIIHPASTIFCEYDLEQQSKMGIRDTTIRLSTGIEEIDDLIDDINSALKEII